LRRPADEATLPALLADDIDVAVMAFGVAGDPSTGAFGVRRGQYGRIEPESGEQAPVPGDIDTVGKFPVNEIRSGVLTALTKSGHHRCLGNGHGVPSRRLKPVGVDAVEPLSGPDGSPVAH
jgi:hypothetical protein